LGIEADRGIRGRELISPFPMNSKALERLELNIKDIIRGITKVTWSGSVTKVWEVTGRSSKTLKTSLEFI
jgi:hypothetical protein